MTSRTPTNPIILALITAALVIGLSYLGLELTARFTEVLDEDIADRIAAVADPRRDLPGLAAYADLVHGWDWEPVSIPSTDSADLSAPEVLTLGDSVTRGFGVEEPEIRSYPALLQQGLSNDREIRVLNAAVPGFGIDQMVLKLESELVRRKPGLVIVAYIPRDLYRSARNINFGITKPVLASYRDGSWNMRPAPDLFEFYRGYQDARSQFRLGPWWLGFLGENQEYYLPMLNRTAYESRFAGVREHLRDLAEAHDIRIILARLANGDLSGTVAQLDEWATRAFSAGDAPSTRFVDVEPCVRELAEEEGLDLNRDFRGHPDARAHALFARCLLPIAKDELSAQP